MLGLRENKTRRWFPHLVVITLVSIIASCDFTSPVSHCSASQKVKPQWDSDLANLLQLTANHQGTPKFVQCLKDLANKQGWEVELVGCRELTKCDWDEAWATTIQTDQFEFAVVLLKSWNGDIPGLDVQSAFLLDNRGRFLDGISCEISSRLTRLSRGQIHAVIQTKPDPDGAQVIIRLDGESASGNFSHRLYHGNEHLEFHWDNNKLPKNQPSQWDANGLCRIAIRDKKFHIVFPTIMGKSE